MAAKFFTGLPLDGPDPECVKGHGETAARRAARRQRRGVPKPTADHSHRTAPRVAGRPVPVTIATRRPVSMCDPDPLAGLDPNRA